MATILHLKSFLTAVEYDEMCVQPLVTLWTIIAGSLLAVNVMAASPVAVCRLDSSMAEEIRMATERAIATYRALGKSLPFHQVEVNPKTSTTAEGILPIWVVQDTSKGTVDVSGCSNLPAESDQKLDSLSVRDGCFVPAGSKREIRCSADAVKLFADRGKGGLPPNPALLYVLAHELAHIIQNRSGEYSGRTVTLTVSQDQSTRLKKLRKNCDPASTTQEEEADELAFSVLAKILPLAPYKEPALSERGSLLWNIDRLALASDSWKKAGAMREFMSTAKVHMAFVPTEFPTPTNMVQANARRFVCDALQSQNKTVSFPTRSQTHPPVEVRLRKIVEALKPIAQQLPSTGGAKGYEPIAELREGLGDIFSQMYRETGIYTEALHENICFIVNGENPHDMCVIAQPGD